MMAAGGALGHSAADTAAGIYALLTDGTTVLIRAARPADAEAVRAMHAALHRTTCTCASSA